MTSTDQWSDARPKPNVDRYCTVVPHGSHVVLTIRVDSDLDDDAVHTASSHVRNGHFSLQPPGSDVIDDVLRVPSHSTYQHRADRVLE